MKIPFSMKPEDNTLNKKIDSLVELLCKELSLNPAEISLLRCSIEDIYKNRKITNYRGSWDNAPPTIEDLINSVFPLTRSQKEQIFKPASTLVDKLTGLKMGDINMAVEMNVSYDDAIVVKTVEEEKYLIKNQQCGCGGALKFIQQSLLKHDNRHYDKIEYVCNDCGEPVYVFFDIEEFFGK